MVYIRLLDHGSHGVRDGASFKLIIRMFFPDGFEIKVGAIHAILQKGEVASVRDTFVGVVELVLEWRCEQE